MADQPGRKSSKGNPATHRMSNAALKERRAASWARGRRRKEARIKAQKDREKANRERRAQGIPTPWEVAKATRKTRRRQARMFERTEP